MIIFVGHGARLSGAPIADRISAFLLLKKKRERISRGGSPSRVATVLQQGQFADLEWSANPPSFSLFVDSLQLVHRFQRTAPLGYVPAKGMSESRGKQIM